MDVNLALEFDNYCRVGWSPRTVLHSPHPQTKCDNKHKPKKSSSKDVGCNLLTLEDGFAKEDNEQKSKRSSSKDVGCDLLTLEDGFAKGGNKQKSKRSSSKDVGCDSLTLEEGCRKSDSKHKPKKSPSETLEYGFPKGDNKQKSKRSSSKDVGCDLLTLEEGCRKSGYKHKPKKSPSEALEDGFAKGDDKQKSKRSSSKDVGYDLLSLEDGFTEIKLRNFRSVSCKSLPTRAAELELERDKFLRRGSVYQASRERKSRRPETSSDRKKIEFSLASESSFSFSILDSICGSDEDETKVEPENSSLMSLDLKERHTSCGKKPAERDTMENRKLRCDKVSSPCNTGNLLLLPHSPSHSEGNNSHRSSSKSHFTPIKKMLDPLTKSKSHRTTKTPLGKSILRRDFFTQPCTSSGQVSANLKVEQKHGVPYFEFSMAQSEDVFVVKTWKDQNALSWVYTFHYVQGKKRSSTIMVGQMQVSCHNPQKNEDSTVVEFVVYDIASARKTEPSKVSSDSNEGMESGDVEIDGSFGVSEPRMSRANSVAFSTPYPWAPADLDPSLEVATVIVRVPLDDDDDNDRASVKVNVVAPVGTHGLPSSVENQGPCPLLKRWRLGGGCECGGWDLGCPLVVFGNRGPQSMEEHLGSEKDQPLKLYLQGGKQKKPALSITVTENGQYLINFYPQLSTLQAFAVCVAILQTTEASFLVVHRKTEQVSSEGVAQFKERRKVADENQLSFVIDPPFSPIARV